MTHSGCAGSEMSILSLEALAGTRILRWSLTKFEQRNEECGLPFNHPTRTGAFDGGFLNASSMESDARLQQMTRTRSEF
jgi:hypothetical protein